MKFICIKDYKMSDDSIAYTKGYVYTFTPHEDDFDDFKDGDMPDDRGGQHGMVWRKGDGGMKGFFIKYRGFR
jgi:hypothetical protein